MPPIAQLSPSAEIAPFFPGVVVESGFELLLPVLVLAGVPCMLLPPPFVDPPDCEPELELELPLLLLLPELEFEPELPLLPVLTELTEPSGDVQTPLLHVVPGLVTHIPGL